MSATFLWAWTVRSGMGQGNPEIIGQRRDEYNDTVHLFMDVTTTYDWVAGESIETRRALCREGVTMKPDGEQFAVGEAIVDEAYLTVEGEVVGEVCGNCQRVLESRI